MPSFRLIARIAMAAMLAAGLAWAQDNDTIADVAGRKPAAHARRVITNDDIPPAPQPGPTPSKGKQGSTQPPSDAKNDPAASLAKAGLDGSSGPDMTAAIEQLRKQEVVLKEKLNRIKDRLAGEDDDFRRQMWNDALENQKSTLDQFRKVRERLEQQQQSDQGKPQTSAASGS